MKKKVFAAAAICALTATGTVFASTDSFVQVIDSWNGIVSVSGTAEPGSYVSLTVLNPGKTDFSPVSKESAQYFGGEVAKEAFSCGHADADGVNYCFHFKIDGESGEYTVIVNADGEIRSQPFDYSSVAAKQDSIKAINKLGEESDLSKREDVLHTAMKNFGLNTYNLYVGNDKGAVIDALIALTPDGGFAYDTAEAVNSMGVVLQKACLVAAYNTDNDDVVSTDGELRYLDSLLSLSGTDELADYNGVIDGIYPLLKDKKLVMGDMFKKTYTTTDEIAEAFKESVRFRVLTAYNARGYGHVEGFLEKYGDYYTDIGFKLDDLEKISDKSDIYSAVASSTAKSITELKKEFNGAVSDAKTKKKSSGGGSGYGGGTVPNYTAEQKNEAADTPSDVPADTPAAPVIETVGGFGDVPVTHWAAEQIKELAADGVINGKDGGLFDPDGTITRAELTKIVMTGILSGADETAENTFADSASHWAGAYIAAAVKSGVVTGISTTQFDPDGLVTREQAAAIICRALTAKGVSLTESTDLFDDNFTIGDWAAEAVYKLKGAGIISGKGGNVFCGSDLLTRSEAAKLVHSARNFKGEK